MESIAGKCDEIVFDSGRKNKESINGGHVNITILCVGKIKESYFASAVKEYEKRLSRYCRLEIIEVADEKTPDGASAAEENKIREIEGRRLLKHMKTDAYRIVLAIDAAMQDSIAFSRAIEKIGVRGYGQIQFVIGGSLGLSPEVLSQADEQLSFSKMTFPHQLMRVILLEQIYRAFRIAANEPYHK